MQKKMIVSMCHGSGTGSADMNIKYLIYGYIQTEGDDCFNVSWKWNWECRYEHKIPHLWLNAEGDDCANVLWTTDVELGLQI